MIYTAVCSLHLEHPVKLKFCFIKNICLTIAAFRNACVICIHRRICQISIKQVSDSLCPRYNIATIVAGIMPATGNINLIICSVNSSLCVMASTMTKISICYSSTTSLEIEHFYRICQQIGIGILFNREFIGII